VFSEAGLAQQVAEKPTDYDPRTRSFYLLAQHTGTRAWTEPYPFLPSYRTGLSRVAPVYFEPGHRLHAVLTVDFDASALAQLLVSSATRGLVRAVVTADGSLLGSSGVVLPAPARLPHDRALKVSDLHDPVLSAAFAMHAPARGVGERTFVLGSQRYFATTATVARLDDHAVTLLSAVNEQQLYAHAQHEALRGIVITAVTALLALVFALAISANIARLRRARAEAEVAAAEARREADALGSYELLELLGRGAMGEVYRARHRLLSREAALKLIRIDEDEDPSELCRLFFEEARRLASMRSVHTVSVYDFGVADDGRYFLAMELLDGLDLDALVRRFGRQPPARVAAILAQICDSLAEAHAAGLVHQDIKPANVFLCHLAEALDFVKVLDFGIARAVGPRGQRLSRSEGTPAFMSPEQILGEPVGPLSDLYAVGGVGFFLLSGTPPFLQGNVEDVQLAHIEDPIPELPEEVRRHVPAALTQLITRCLAKRPEHRPVSAKVLAEALRSIAQQCAETFPEAVRDGFWRALEEERLRRRASLPSLSSHVRTVLARSSAHNTRQAS
jgi:serine/threonine protein kinase